MKIANDVKKELDSFELSELTKLLETVEDYEMYASGLHRISGGYASAFAFDISQNEDENEVIDVQLQSGVAEAGQVSCTKLFYILPRCVLNSKLTDKQKLKELVEK